MLSQVLKKRKMEKTLGLGVYSEVQGLCLFKCARSARRGLGMKSPAGFGAEPQGFKVLTFIKP
jgi:hypothetical protein